jgi:hypothetical protein
MARRKDPPSSLLSDAARSREQKNIQDAGRQEQKWQALNEHNKQLNAARVKVEDRGRDYEKEQRADEAYLRNLVQDLADFRTLVVQSPDPKANKVKLPDADTPPPQMEGFEPDAFADAFNLFLKSDTNPTGS